MTVAGAVSSSPPPTRPPVDLIDAAFLGRLEQPPAVAEPPRTVDAPGMPLDLPIEPPAFATAFATDAVVDRLLRLVPDAWQRVADRVEAAGRAGHRVIAFAGGCRGEGRTTLVAGVAATLAARGRPVRCASPEETSSPDGADADTLTLVDAGVWFPPGPLRMERIAALAQGCDAVILVRRAGEAPCPARGEALARLGVACLGELETFAAP